MIKTAAIAGYTYGENPIKELYADYEHT